MSAVLKQGNLTKKSGGYSMLWQERTFQLYATKLDYSVDGFVKGSIQITPKTEVCEVPPPDANSSRFGFKVTSPLGQKNELVLIASSEEEKQAWIGSIKLAVNGGGGSAANVFQAAMKPISKKARDPMTEEQAANVIKDRFKNWVIIWKAQKLAEAKRQAVFAAEEAKKEAKTFHAIVARPIRCFKKLDNESEFQERWIWLDMITNQFHWAKKNPIEGGEDVPGVVPPPVEPPMTKAQKKLSMQMGAPSVGSMMPSASSMMPSMGMSSMMGGSSTSSSSMTNSMTRGLTGAATGAAMSAVAGAAANGAAAEAMAAAEAATAAALAEAEKPKVVEVTKEQAATAGSKSFTVKTFDDVKGYVTSASSKETCVITPGKDGKETKCAQLVLKLDPSHTPSTLMSAGKGLMSSLTLASIGGVELYIPHDTTGERPGSAFYYADVMRKVVIAGKVDM